MPTQKDNKINVMISLSFVLFLVDFFLVSELNIASLSGLRIQDIAALLTVLFGMPIFHSLRSDGRLRNLVRFSVFYFYYLSLTNLFFMIKHDLWFKHVFYVLKEFEFLLAFFITVYIFAKRPSWAMNLIKSLVILNASFGMFQILTGQISYYGIGTIVSRAPSVAGNVYFVSMVVMFFMYMYYRQLNFLMWSLFCVILTLFTISRTYIVVTILFLVTFYSMEMVTKVIRRNKFSYRTSFLFLCFIVCLLFTAFFVQDISKHVDNLAGQTVFLPRILHRMSVLGHASDYRSEKAKQYYRIFVNDSVSVILFGQGKGRTEQYFGVSTLAVDNQYIRSLIEMGVVGITLWLLIIIAFVASLKESNDTLKRNIFIAILVSYFAASIGTEVFQTTHPGFAFWFLAGMIYGTPKRVIE